MKAEERHELKDNDLMSWMKYGLPIWLKQNGSYVLLVLALCFLGWRLWVWHEARLEQAHQAAWADLRSVGIDPLHLEPGANPPTHLMAIFEQYEDPAIKAGALEALGQFYLNCVADNTYPTQVTADEAIAKAREAYQRLLNEFGKDTLVAGKAHLGLAAAAEDLADVADKPADQDAAWDEAKKQYDALTTGPFVGTGFDDLAQSFLDSLDRRRNAPRLARILPAATPIATAPGSTRPSFEPLPPLFSPTANPAATSTGSQLPAGILLPPPTFGPSLPTTRPGPLPESPASLPATMPR